LLTPEEVFNDVLQAIKLRSIVFVRSKWTAPWGFYSKAPIQPRFHFVLSGRCWFSAEDFIEPTCIRDGDLVIVAPDQPYRMRDELSSQTLLLDDIIKRRSPDEKKARVFSCGSGGEATRLLCGCFFLEELSLNPLARSLPAALIVRRESDAGDSLRSAFYTIENEYSAGRPGAEAIVTRLMEVIFLQAIRASFEWDRKCRPGWISALQDPAIGKAVVMIHARLSSTLTVDALARESGMSRSAFAARFTQMLGESPISYVARWRMNRAAQLLGASDEKIAAVAHKVGYESVTAFTKAFKQHLALSPGAYRRHCPLSDRFLNLCQRKLSVSGRSS
jgi:AraC family transcriptional regulator, alkane utilization regulator